MANTVQLIESLVQGISALNNLPIPENSEEYERLAEIDQYVWSLIDDIEEKQ